MRGERVGVAGEQASQGGALADGGQKCIARNSGGAAGELDQLPGEGHIVGEQAAEADHAFIADRRRLDHGPVRAEHLQRDDPLIGKVGMGDRRIGVEQDLVLIQRNVFDTRLQPRSVRGGHDGQKLIT